MHVRAIVLLLVRLVLQRPRLFATNAMYLSTVADERNSQFLRSRERLLHRLGLWTRRLLLAVAFTQFLLRIGIRI